MDDVSFAQPLEREPTWVRALIALVGVGAYALATVRGLNPVCSYAFSHWLLTWNHGFIKRGLVGTLVHPLLVGRTSADIHWLVTAMASVSFAVMSAALLVAAWRVAMAPVGPLRWPVRLVVLAFLGSSGVILAASTLGFFDHLLLLMTLAAVEAIRRGWTPAVALVCVVALGIHEMFALYGFPVVALALAARARQTGEWRPLLWLAVPVLTLLALTVSSSALTQARIDEVRGDLEALRCLTSQQVTNAVFHLEHNFAENVELQRGKMLRHLLDPKINRVAWPTALALLVSSWGLLRGSATSRPTAGAAGAVGAGLATLAVVVTPLLAHVFAWDATRFTHFVVMQSFVCLYVVVRIAQPQPRPGATRLRRVEQVVLCVLALWSIVATQVWRAPLMTGYVDGKGIITITSSPAEPLPGGR